MVGKRSLLSRTIKSGRVTGSSTRASVTCVHRLPMCIGYLCASVTCVHRLPVCIGCTRNARHSRVRVPSVCCAPPALPCCIVECGPGVTSVATLHGRIYIILPMTMRAITKSRKEKTAPKPRKIIRRAHACVFYVSLVRVLITDRSTNITLYIVSAIAQLLFNLE